MQKHLQEFFIETAINIGLPIIECDEAAKDIEEGDQVEIDFDSGMIYNKTKSEQSTKDRLSLSLCRRLFQSGGLN